MNLGIEQLPEIEVAVPKVNSYTQATCIPTRTFLFRESSKLPIACQAICDRVDEEDVLAASSFGCGEASEADSAAAILRILRPLGQFSMTGYDINPAMVARARSGLHWIPAVNDAAKLESLGQMLLDSGFDFDPRVDFDQNNYSECAFADNPDGGYHKINANPLRCDGKFKFVQRDLLSGCGRDEIYDLILANNILYYYSGSEATHLMSHFAERLSDRGILSIGQNATPGKAKEVFMGGYFGHRQVSFYDWINRTVEFLEDKYGVKALNSDEDSIPIMFAREL